MPISVTSTSGGSAYVDIRVGDSHNIHQQLFNVAAALQAELDADGYVPVGLPLLATGDPVSAPAQTAVGVVGPEAVKLGTADHFGNVILDGVLNQDAIEDNLGRALSADELAALTAGGFTLV